MWLIRKRTLLFSWGARLDGSTLTHLILYSGLVFGLLGYLLSFVWIHGYTTAWVASLVLITAKELTQEFPEQFFDLADWMPVVALNTSIYFKYFN